MLDLEQLTARVITAWSSTECSNINTRLDHVNYILVTSGAQCLVSVTQYCKASLMFIHRLSMAVSPIQLPQDKAFTELVLSKVLARMTLTLPALEQTYQFQQEMLNDKMAERRKGGVGCLAEGRDELKCILTRQIELADFLARLDAKKAKAAHNKSRD